MSVVHSRARILALYRSCLRSKQRIPDPEQRLVYDEYIRKAFRSKQHLIPGSKQANLAIEDAQEQLERMDYYHSIRELKEQERQEANKPNAAKESSSKIQSDKRTALLISDPSEKYETVRKWLLDAVPQLHDEDVNVYASKLVEDGFDSNEMLRTELLEEDLKFMKKAHLRALIRAKDIPENR